MSTTFGQKTARIALVGKPNVGKSTIFNALTGGTQKIGNYPGVTVEIAKGSYCVQGRVVECIDVPGLYSLRAISEDESVALRVLQGGDEPIDLYVIVMDAGSMERCLFLYSQVAELGLPIIVALTMTDVAPNLDKEALASRLGVPVVPVVAHKNEGVKELQDLIERTLEAPVVPDLELGFPERVRVALQRLAEFKQAPNIHTLRLWLLREEEPPKHISDDFRAALTECREDLLGANLSGKVLDSQTRYAWAASVRKQVEPTETSPLQTRTDKIDRILTHRVWGLLIFTALMYLVFQSIYTLATPLMDGIETAMGALSDAVSPLLAGTPLVHDLVVDGVIGGVGGVLVFLPQIMILFFFISVLEGTGYLARAAFLMDRLLGWCGLNGRAFIPLLSSYACAIPGVMAARVMPDPKARLATILVAPLMSCSARLPVYVLLIGVFIESKYGTAVAGLTLFIMHLLGLAVAVPVAWILNRGVLKGPRLPFLLEFPRYQWPRWRDVVATMGNKAKTFVTTAGTVILAMTILIWAALYFPQSSSSDAGTAYAQLSTAQQEVTSLETFEAQYQLEQSYLGRFGRAVAPAFEPAGFDWRLTTSLVAAFPAREVVVGAMSVIFGMGEGEDSKELRTALATATRPDGTPLMNLGNALSMMVFFALCCQCLTTVATIQAETKSAKWAWFAFGYMTVLAYVFAIVTYQLFRGVA
ncbi:MAG TPA: ferrous iron transport protein B [Fimbriimonadaceae bacterium]|nr:ferrous iron transport protein B [Armatimonadota bacterium]HCM74357.1 ferrous iron transport protein B [Armatimonadota bacterium]HRD32218.1 ferrous iron transport protein B [Fimbriimonadaceae bacterium]HRE93238.1 ferrous iron transport protein B [Fimbriimonadaceae bacterium]HRI74672.1 ferrous iron transport protein B [Fimbriimonadaceae bacterium]